MTSARSEHLPTTCQWCDPRAAAHAHPQRAEPSPLGVHAASRRAPRGLRGSGASLGAAVALARPGRRGADSLRRLRVSRAGGRDDAPRSRPSWPATPLISMPPFLGQGLCSGIRDAGNLAWKLDLVLRGLKPGRTVGLLHGRAQARSSEWIVRLSMEMARVSCELDPDAAAERDAALRAGETPPPLGLPGITQGLVQSARRTARARSPGRLPSRGPSTGPRAKGASTTSSGAASSCSPRR